MQLLATSSEPLAGLGANGGNLGETTVVLDGDLNAYARKGQANS